MPERVELSAEVSEELHGTRLDRAASALFPAYSRSRLQTWIREGSLLVDGKSGRPRDTVRAGNRLVVSAQLEREVPWQPQDIELQVVYEDEDLMLLDKPAGLVVHPAAGHADGTLVNALLAHDPGLARLPRAGLVHRLDRDTSGIMAIARTLRAHRALVAQLQARTMRREYCAICVGVMTGGGTVDAPIGRHPRQRKQMAVLESGGKTAITHYQVEQRFGHHTLIGVSLETGRTHQIRVHLAHRRHPLVGDPVYGGRPRMPRGASAALIEALRGFGRQALHARRLGLLHPASGEPVVFDCSLPDDMCTLIALLARDDPAPVGDAAPH